MQEKNEDSGDTATESKIEQEEQCKRYDSFHRGIRLAFFVWAIVALILIPKVLLISTFSKDFAVSIAKFIALPFGVLLILMLADFFLYRIDLEKEELEKEKMKILELMKQ